MLTNKDRQKLPGIGPRDPRNLLSHEARIRLDDAVLRQQDIRNEALANIVRRCGIPRDGAWDGAAVAQWSDANVRAGAVSLSSLCRELMLIGKYGKELRDLMEEELVGYANSCELSGIEKQAIWSKLLLVRVEEVTQQSAILPEVGNPRQTEADQRFATEEQREAAIRRAKEQFGTSAKFADSIGVHYSDLRKWVRKRRELLSKNGGHSAKVDKIERTLLSI